MAAADRFNKKAAKQKKKKIVVEPVSTVFIYHLILSIN